VGEWVGELGDWGGRRVKSKKTPGQFGKRKNFGEELSWSKVQAHSGRVERRDGAGPTAKGEWHGRERKLAAQMRQMRHG
jgi:hypothetical protein